MSFVLIFPDKVIIDSLSTVNKYALTRTELVCDRKEIRPFGNFLGCRPASERRLLHYLLPKLGIFYYAFIQRGQYSARIEAVTSRAVRCNSESHVLCIRKDPTLTCALFGEFRPRVGARRSDIKY